MYSTYTVHSHVQYKVHSLVYSTVYSSILHMHLQITVYTRVGRFVLPRINNMRGAASPTFLMRFVHKTLLWQAQKQSTPYNFSSRASDINNYYEPLAGTFKICTS